MNGKGRRNKGIRGENEFCKLLSDQLGEVFHRNLTQTREGGGDLLEVKGWVIELKRQEALSRPSWWAQACRQAEGKGEPAMCYRRNREPWRCFVHTRDGMYRETDVAGFADAIREKWAMWP